MTEMIRFKDVIKSYDNVLALDGISLTIEKGRVYGLIGRNGSGKTTMLKLMAKMLQKTSGEILFNEEIISKNSDMAFSRDFNYYFSNYKIGQLIKTAALIYPEWDGALEKELLEIFDLDKKKTYSKCSKGMQTMVSLLITLCSGAKVLLLDEPYVGLDPINRDSFYRILREKFFDGEKTVIISSHLINELEGYFERAIFINKGKLLIDDEVDNIYEKSFTIVCDSRLAEEVRGRYKVLDEEKMGHQSTLYIYDSLSKDREAELIQRGARINRMDLQQLLIKLCVKREVK